MVCLHEKKTASGRCVNKLSFSLTSQGIFVLLSNLYQIIVLLCSPYFLPRFFLLSIWLILSEPVLTFLGKLEFSSRIF